MHVPLDVIFKFLTIWELLHVVCLGIDSSDSHNIEAGTAFPWPTEDTESVGREGTLWFTISLAFNLTFTMECNPHGNPRTFVGILCLHMGCLRRCRESLVEVKLKSSFPENWLSAFIILLLCVIVEFYKTSFYLHSFSWLSDIYGAFAMVLTTF